MDWGVRYPETDSAASAGLGPRQSSIRPRTRESDTETGLYYYPARYYDLSAGRFLSEDRIQFEGGMLESTFSDTSAITQGTALIL